MHVRTGNGVPFFFLNSKSPATFPLGDRRHSLNSCRKHRKSKRSLTFGLQGFLDSVDLLNIIGSLSAASPTLTAGRFGSPRANARHLGDICTGISCGHHLALATAPEAFFGGGLATMRFISRIESSRVQRHTHGTIATASFRDRTATHTCNGCSVRSILWAGGDSVAGTRTPANLQRHGRNRVRTPPADSHPTSPDNRHQYSQSSWAKGAWLSRS